MKKFTKTTFGICCIRGDRESVSSSINPSDSPRLPKFPPKNSQTQTLGSDTM